MCEHQAWQAILDSFGRSYYSHFSDCVAMLYLFNTGRSIVERYALLMDATKEIKLESTTAHLWFEEVISVISLLTLKKPRNTWGKLNGMHGQCWKEVKPQRAS